MAGNNNDDLDTNLGNEFDPEAQLDKNAKLSELKKHNMKSVFGTGAGRLALIAVGGVFITFAVIGSYNLFKRNDTQGHEAVNANRAVLSAPPTQADSAVISEQEAQLRRESINQQAATAATEGKSYIAPPVLRAEEQHPLMRARDNDLSPTPQQQREQMIAQSTTTVDQAAAAAEAARAAEIAAIKQNWPQIKKEQIEPQLQVALGRAEDGKSRSAFMVSNYALPDRTPKDPVAPSNGTVAQTAAHVAQNPSANPIAGRVPFIQAGDGYYCETDYAVNTDSPRNDSVATCHHGKLAGAKVIGKYDPTKENAPDGGVSFFFTSLSIPGKGTVAIQAMGIDDASEMANMADEVDNHTFKKYGGLVLASTLRGIGKAASMVTGSTTTVSTGAMSSTQTVTEPMTAARQAKIAAGEVGMTMADSIQRDSDQIKRTIKLGSKKGIRVVFLADVFVEKK